MIYEFSLFENTMLNHLKGFEKKNFVYLLFGKKRIFPTTSIMMVFGVILELIC